jgi:hypothetical protein
LPSQDDDVKLVFLFYYRVKTDHAYTSTLWDSVTLYGDVMIYFKVESAKRGWKLSCLGLLLLQYSLETSGKTELEFVVSIRTRTWYVEI